MGYFSFINIYTV